MRPIALSVRYYPGALALLALAALAPASHAYVTELRFVERTGQTVADPADGVLNLAVQARVRSAGNVAGLFNTTFSITIDGEAESRGTLTRDRTTNADGTYFSGIAGPGGGGTFSGLAGHYGYVAGINAAFNGVINASAASWTQTPSQDIGLIFADAQGQTLLNTPGVDDNFDGIPDTAVGTQAVLPAPIMQGYFGAGDWVDIYRFRYTLSDFTPRTLNFVFGGDRPGGAVLATAFTTVDFVSGIWRPTGPQTSPAELMLTNLSIPVIPTPATASMLACAAVTFLRRRRS